MAQHSHQQIYDKAEWHYVKGELDSAFTCYSLLINSPPAPSNREQQICVIHALNRMGSIYTIINDYRSAYEFYSKALNLSEQISYTSYEPKFYNNVGNIYFRFKNYALAKSFFYKALSLDKDSAISDIIFTNLAATELESERIDSAFYYLNKALSISHQYENLRLFAMLNNMASTYEKTKQYDSAFYYYKLSLIDARKNHQIKFEAETFTDIGKLFFEINKPDSALFYINMSNAIAKEKHLLRIMAENYFALSKYEESKGYTKNAFKYLKKYITLKDSVLNTEIFGDINHFQRLYEVTKTNRKIEQLVVEQQIKEQTIRYQKIIWIITFSVLVFAIAVLMFIYLQKRKLNTAYKALVEKNIEIIEMQNNPSETYRKKYQKSALTDILQRELLEKILSIMENTAIICDTKFTVDRLAELVHSNQLYVSQAINSALKKNFRSLLNSYRIREAQRLFSDPNITKYTIQSVAFQVGFKSQSAFRDAFREFTGVNPNFYLKSLHKGILNI